MSGSGRRDWLKQSAALLAAPWALPGVAGAGAKGERIRVGQIGVGHAHASKLSVYRQSDDYEVVGVVEPDDRLRAEAKDQPPYRGLPFLTREQLFNTPGLKAVLVETRVPDLLENAEAAVAAGFHVHLDKPAGSSLPHYRQILEAASKRNLWVQMGYMYRYNPSVILLREFLSKGWLGEVFEVQAAMSKVIGPRERLPLAATGGGTMFELGCHVIDLVVAVLGAPGKITPFARHTSPIKDDLVDNMLAVFEYPKATAAVRSTALEVEGFARRHLTVCGTEGTFHIQPLDDPAVRVALSQARGSYRKGYQDVAFPKFSRYVADAADMARVIRGESPIPFSPAHDLAVQTAVLRASGLPID